MTFAAFIPARYASTRFPGKPLALLGGKTIIEHVYRRATETIPQAWVATDDQRIFDAVTAFGGRAIMTSANHRSGTDRVAEAVEKTGTEADVIINLQGDEPFIHREQLEAICRCFDDADTQIATLATPFTSIEATENPNSPKVVVDAESRALYFSRSVVPYVRGAEREQWLERYPFLKHIGIYAFRRDVLKEITRLPQAPVELAESLEQLRWLYYGYRIKVGTTSQETVGIDTPDDLKRAEEMLRH